MFLLKQLTNKQFFKISKIKTKKINNSNKMKSDLDFDATQDEKKILHKIISDAYSKTKNENLALVDVLQSYDIVISNYKNIL